MTLSIFCCTDGSMEIYAGGMQSTFFKTVRVEMAASWSETVKAIRENLLFHSCEFKLDS